jgi:DnaA family protein
MTLPRQLTLDLVEPAKPSLDNFVVGRNAEVIAALRAIVADAGDRFVYLWGDRGAGRTHLLQALDVDASQEVPAFDPNRRLYALDDVDRCSESEQQRLFVLLNEIRADGRARLVAAGNVSPLHLALRDDVRTRLSWGLVYQVHGLTDEEKAQALAAHAESRGVALSPEVIDHLLTHMPRDMRTLVAIVDALDDYALSVKRAVTLPLVREWSHRSL